MTKRKKIEERIAADEDEIKRQLEQQRREREYYSNNVDGRPRDSGAMLDALIREHGKKDQSGR